MLIRHLLFIILLTILSALTLVSLSTSLPESPKGPNIISPRRAQAPVATVTVSTAQPATAPRTERTSRSLAEELAVLRAKAEAKAEAKEVEAHEAAGRRDEGRVVATRAADLPSERDQQREAAWNAAASARPSLSKNHLGRASLADAVKASPYISGRSRPTADAALLQQADRAAGASADPPTRRASTVDLAPALAQLRARSARLVEAVEDLPTLSGLELRQVAHHALHTAARSAAGSCSSVGGARAAAEIPVVETLLRSLYSAQFPRDFETRRDARRFVEPEFCQELHILVVDGRVSDGYLTTLNRLLAALAIGSATDRIVVPSSALAAFWPGAPFSSCVEPGTDAGDPFRDVAVGTDRRVLRLPLGPVQGTFADWLGSVTGDEASWRAAATLFLARPGPMGTHDDAARMFEALEPPPDIVAYYDYSSVGASSTAIALWTADLRRILNGCQARHLTIIHTADAPADLLDDLVTASGDLPTVALPLPNAADALATSFPAARAAIAAQARHVIRVAAARATIGHSSHLMTLATDLAVGLGTAELPPVIVQVATPQ